jgi:hypothetical protein
MALWRNIGGVTSIVPGATHYWEYGYGRDVGVAIAAPNMQQPQINVELVVLRQGVVQRQSRGEGAPLIDYTVRIQNIGGIALDYNLNIGDWQ